MKKRILTSICCIPLLSLFSSCYRDAEYSRSDIEALGANSSQELIERTAVHPWPGYDSLADGESGGTWYSTASGDPKSFNLLIAEQDSETASVLGQLHIYLAEYDTATREWIPNAASFEVKTDARPNTTSVYYTLRGDLYWSFYHSDEKIPVTSDDVVFWYNEISGDKAFNSSSYNSQSVILPDGTSAHIDIERIDDKRFAFHIPGSISEPILSTNMDFGPSFIYRPAKEKDGVQGVLNVFNVSTDVQTIPSMGPYFITEYTPGLRIVYERNPDYFKKDSAGRIVPYKEYLIQNIIADPNTSYLLFKEGSLEASRIRTENLEDALDDPKAKNYSIYRDEGSLNVPFWTFNQNPKNSSQPYYRWFTQKEFRQAMSCLINRDRIVTQGFRGLGTAKYVFFPEPNPFYNPDIRLDYVYDPARAVSLLESIGFSRDSQGTMRDSEGNAIEFDLVMQTGSQFYTDAASILTEDLRAVGIKLNVRPTDFQKVVQQLTSTYDWQSAFMLFGPALWPTQGSNVWPSDGNLHMWYPLQESPATDWEARIDYLYQAGKSELDPKKAKVLWDEYQRILLEQCPVIYLASGLSFMGVSNRWDQRNVYFDNVEQLNTAYAYLAQ